ncbi:hypothetical protein PIB30_050942 [Stylosanthes scabra]|uniref:Uncharacterized protein n=1 Tax=Stylosanthes scabra TaxID=79078 RepID=A0ABU6UH50_9FABA|nr:hypothetical protein [Stylosanthes scabra]
MEKACKTEISQRSKNEKQRKGTIVIGIEQTRIFWKDEFNIHNFHVEDFFQAIGNLTSRASKRYRCVIYVRLHGVTCDHTYWSDVQVMFSRPRGGTGIPLGRTVARATLNFEEQFRYHFHNWFGFCYNEPLVLNDKEFRTDLDYDTGVSLSSNGAVAEELKDERKELRENQRRIKAQVTTLQLSVLRFVIQSANSNFNNFSIASQPLNSEDFPSQALSIPRGRIPTLFLCTNQEGREDALLNEDNVKSVYHEDMHECLEEVEEENEALEVEDVDQEVEDKDKEPKGMEIVYSASSEATPSKLPSKLQFEWVNFSNLNFIGPLHYALLETDDQLRALYGVLGKQEIDSVGLDESRFFTCGKSESESYSGHLNKLHNNRAKVGAFSLRKYLGPWQFQEKLVDSQGDGWTNQVWDPGKSYKNQHFWGVITCIGAFRDLLNMNWDPIENMKFKHWWGFKDEFKHKPP